MCIYTWFLDPYKSIFFKNEELIEGDTSMSLLLAPHQEEKKGGDWMPSFLQSQN